MSYDIPDIYPGRELALINKLRENIESVIRSNNQSIKWLLAAFFSGGHVLLEDVPGTGKTTLAKIHSVIENQSNPNYVRRNILVKGAIIETDKGRARITSRPGKDGVINGILLE